MMGRRNRKTAWVNVHGLQYAKPAVEHLPGHHSGPRANFVAVRRECLVFGVTLCSKCFGGPTGEAEQ